MIMAKSAVVIASNGLEKSTNAAVVTFHVTKQGITIRVQSLKDVAGLQVDMTNIVSTPASISSPFSQAAFKLENKVLRIVLVDKDAKTLAAGTHTIATIPMSIINLNEIGVKNLKVGSSDAELLNSSAVITNKEAENETLVPSVYSLNQNYPNPFNPTTVIRFSVPQTSDVRIVVYNMLGQQVRILYAGMMEAGSQTVSFDGKDYNGHALASGTYMYRMIAGTFVETKKMVLMK